MDSKTPVVLTPGGFLRNITEVMKEHRNALDKFDVNDSSSDSAIKCSLAAEFGDLTPSSVEKMDDDTLLLVTAVVKYLKKHLEVPDFTNCLSLLSQIIVTTVDRSKNDIRSEVLVEKDDDIMSKDGKPTSDIIRKVKSWLTKVVDDNDIFKALDLERHFPNLARFLTKSSGKSAAETILGTQTEEGKILNVAVLRFPDESSEYFLLYQLKISAWRTSEFDPAETGLKADDTNGLKADFHFIKYIARKTIMDRLSTATKKKARRAALDFFNIKSLPE